MSLNNHRVSLSLSLSSLLVLLLLLLLLLASSSSVDTAPDQMPYHRDSKFCTYIGMGLVIMHMKYLVTLTHTVKIAAIFDVFFVIIILPILFISEIRYFAYVCINVSSIFS